MSMGAPARTETGGTVGRTAGGTAAAAPRWLDDHEQAVWRSFLAMRSQLDVLLGRELQEQSGLSNADFSVLVQLSEHPETRMRVLELARALQWEKSRLSHQLTRMQQRGLVERSNCVEDRRGAWILLTAQGLTAVEAAAPRHVESVRRYLFDVLSAEQVAALGDVARVVLDRIGEQCAGKDVCAGDGADADGQAICDSTGVPTATGCSE
jgi:DNA-binding MarR family transcriptional regulator